jgi:hypothetical protein
MKELIEAVETGPVTTKLCRMANDFTESAFCQKFELSKPRIQESGFFWSFLGDCRPAKC